MKKMLVAFAAVTVLTLACAAPSFASGRTVHRTTTRVVVHNAPVRHAPQTVRVANYHLSHGVRFAHGYLYRGRDHFHWTARRFDPRYGCDCYFDPCVGCWYYFCVPDNCFYPVNYCPYRIYRWGPPVAVQPIVVPPMVPVPVTPQPVDAIPPIPAPVMP